MFLSSATKKSYPKKFTQNYTSGYYFDFFCKTTEIIQWQTIFIGSKPTRVILLCPWDRHFTALSPAWWSWQAVLSYSHTSIKLQADSNILVSPEAGRGNCLPYVLAPSSLSCESGG